LIFFEAISQEIRGWANGLLLALLIAICHHHFWKMDARPGWQVRKDFQEVRVMRLLEFMRLLGLVLGSLLI
jgi:hypothetical protein